MALPPNCLAIIDVGHGNCAVLRDGERTILIDAAAGSTLLEFLIQQKITTIDLVLLSHADKDHIGGLLAVLSSGVCTISQVYVNSDAEKGSASWDDLLYELEQVRRRGGIAFHVGLTAQETGKFDRAPIQIQVAAPTPYLAAKGPGGTDRGGRKLTSNSLSAVIRILVNGEPVALLAGDIDDVGLDDMLAAKPDLIAPLLVYPHHGGASAADVDEFAKKLCAEVKPATVVFSVGRGRRMPRPDVVVAVRKYVREIRVACTQLSEHCATVLPRTDPTHLNDAFAQGREGRKCCAGTLVIDFAKPAQLLPTDKSHLTFIAASAPTALCR